MLYTLVSCLEDSFPALTKYIRIFIGYDRNVVNRIAKRTVDCKASFSVMYSTKESMYLYFLSYKGTILQPLHQWC